MGAVAWTSIDPVNTGSEKPETHIARTQELYACGEARDERMPLIRVPGGFDLIDCDACAYLWTTEGGW